MNNTCMPPQFIRLGNELNQHGHAALQLHASSSCPVIFHGTFLAAAASPPSAHGPTTSEEVIKVKATTMNEKARLCIDPPVFCVLNKSLASPPAPSIPQPTIQFQAFRRIYVVSDSSPARCINWRTCRWL